jgi:serine/threonine protein kinase
LILDKNNKLVLIDFNVAQQNQWTTTGTVVGKHAYLPPEQFRGQPCPQSDLYAMGATLFFLCTGLEPEPISCSHPRELNSSIDRDFDELVAKLTAVDLEDRFQNIGEVSRELNRVVSAAKKLARIDSVTVDSARVDSAKVDSARVDSAKVDSARVDSVTVDSIKATRSLLSSIKVRSHG